MGVGGQVLQERWEEALCLPRGALRGLGASHRRTGPLAGFLSLEVGEQWLIAFLPGLREASQERAAHSL